MHHFREILVGECAFFRFRPRLAEDPERGRFELLPMPISLEIELKLGDKLLLAAVAKSLLDLPKHDRMDMLAVARHPSDVEHDGYRIDGGA